MKKNYFRILRRVVLILSIFLQSHLTFSQADDDTKPLKHFGGAVTATNNGISLLPTFSLGKPAVMFDINVGNKKLSFEPQFRFSLEGKPWSFIFWWRYKLLESEKFKIRVGAHPAIAFKSVISNVNGTDDEILVAQRYLAGEFAPNYYITKTISVGMYYLHAHGFSESGTRNTDFITLNSNFSNIKLTENFFMKFNPQVYYLRMDDNDGFYATATLGLALKNFPISFQSILNHSIETNIPAKNEFVWNMSLIYSFNNEYYSKK